jgi:hypothetical protein
MLSVVNCVADCVWLAVPETTEWKRIGNQVDAAIILARADFVNVGRMRGAYHGTMKILSVHGSFALLPGG